MLTHADILGALTSAYPAGSAGGAPSGVFLVSRLVDADLAVGDDTPHIFVPDCHVVPPEDAEQFPRVTTDAVQLAALQRLFEVLTELKAVPNGKLVVWHLGDLVDLWRVGDLGARAGTRMARVTEQCAPLFSSLNTLLPNGLKENVLAGNHDIALQKHLELPREVLLADGAVSSHTWLLHGDQFDGIETLLSARVKEEFARGFTQKVPAAAMTILEATNPHFKPKPIDEPLPKPPTEATHFMNAGLQNGDQLPLQNDSTNVLEHSFKEATAEDNFLASLGAASKKVKVDGPGQKFFSGAAEKADKLDKKGHDIRLVVIGHTHQPRIVRGERKGKRFVMMDCGAWIGTGFLSRGVKQPIRNAHIGVKVGNDLRIYQINCTPAV